MEDARVHCVVLKVRAEPTPPRHNRDSRTGPRGTTTTHTSHPTSATSARPLRTQQRACIDNSEPDRSSGKPRTEPENLAPDTKSYVPPMS